MKSNMVLEVSFLAGTSIQEAIDEARYFALKHNLTYVKFNFNGISMSIQPYCSVRATAEAFLKAMKNGDKYVIGVRGDE